ncbi:hypothetical protein [Nocardiopsis sp. NPDC055824]
MSLTYLSEFAGVGGDSEGAHHVEGLTPIFAANHNPDAIESHAANFPDVEHWCGDVQNAGGTPTFPHANVAWHSPACPDWTTAKGVVRTFDSENQMSLWEAEKSPEALAEEAAAKRSRALMEEVIIYLRTWHRRGRIVQAGVVENVVECRNWAEWGRWVGEFESMGYIFKLIALNSMHALAPGNRRCSQSRNRLFGAYIHKSVGRTPHWDRWLRPVAYCDVCQKNVRAMQVFKDPSRDMGKYGSQYLYRCPNTTCRNQVLEPEILPAGAIIDFSDPGTPIGERKATKGKQGGLSPKTIARIEAGMRQYWAPLLTPTGGSWRENAIPLTHPMPTRLTRESDGIAVPPLIVPLEGREKPAKPATDPLRTQTCRRESGIALPPFITPLRGGGDLNRAYATSQHLHTVTAGGFHHGLAQAPAEPERLLVQYFSNGRSWPVSDTVGTLTTKDRYGLATAPTAAAPQDQVPFDINSVLFRMLNIPEIQAAMAFPDSYLLTPPSKRIKARLLGNAVTPNCAEVILSALVEAITGEYRPSGWDLYEDSGWNYWNLAA